MKRLVYSPKAYVFTKTRKGKIINATNYVTAGQVRRVIGAVSNAQVTLRNPDMIFTTPDAKTASVAFMPMDPITIFLERLKGHPVRVFTGFLDDSPYLQLYPGTITINASCTLKRLQYTYFDPALPYTQSFLAAYGWINKEGTVFNLTGLNDWQNPNKDQAAQYGDGSVGELLFATLKHIGNWDDNEISIEKLPRDLFERLGAIYTQFDDTNAIALKEFTNLLEDIIGASNYGGAGAGAGGTLTTGRIKDEKKIVEAMSTAAEKWNVPAEMVVATWLIEWPGLHDSPGNPHYGWFQWDVKNGTPGSYQAAGVTRKGDCYDCGEASDIFAEALHRNKRHFPSSDWHSLVEKTQGVNQGGINNPLYRTSWNDKVNQARGMVSRYANTTNAASKQADNTVDTTKTASTNGASGTTKIYRPIEGHTVLGRGWHESSKGVSGMTTTSGHLHWHSGLDVSVPGGTPCIAPADGKITMSTLNWSDGGMIHFQFTHDVGEIKAGTVIGWGHVQRVYKHTGDTVRAGEHLADSGVPSGGAHVHFIQRHDSASGDGDTDPKPLFMALDKGQTSPTSGGDVSGGGSGGSGDNSGPFAIADSFRATFNFASIEESFEAIGLFGERSLMNDKPLLPFIQQLCDASLRQFQSLPDGRFFAFYPDYFGEMLQHPPYWEISDIEILNGGIRLSDDPTVTHMFVVGDVTWPASVDLVNRLSTAGIVNVFNAFLSSQLTPSSDAAERKDNPLGMNLLLDKDEATTFLNRFGARPMVEDMPMIHSHFYEFFLAYQKFMLAWARQFQSEFEFTFMPELYPGGKVGFPDHGIQMYIEEVEHAWNYENGFTTDAKLSAPSVYRDNPKGLPPHMVRAIIASE
jgi:murein DD-endopeptidase MepM/ murein hydrolase activator NlpD